MTTNKEFIASCKNVFISQYADRYAKKKIKNEQFADPFLNKWCSDINSIISVVDTTLSSSHKLRPFLDALTAFGKKIHNDQMDEIGWGDSYSTIAINHIEAKYCHEPVDLLSPSTTRTKNQIKQCEEFFKYCKKALPYEKSSLNDVDADNLDDDTDRAIIDLLKFEKLIDSIDNIKKATDYLYENGFILDKNSHKALRFIVDDYEKNQLMMKKQEKIKKGSEALLDIIEYLGTEEGRHILELREMLNNGEIDMNHIDKPNAKIINTLNAIKDIISTDHEHSSTSPSTT